ncbi:MAG: hypothetical protein LBP89_10115 [Helicobacteraceae bacterium]|nr:hypothetical protein [Helicobacteraceae bacterium]
MVKREGLTKENLKALQERLDAHIKLVDDYYIAMGSEWDKKLRGILSKGYGMPPASIEHAVRYANQCKTFRSERLDMLEKQVREEGESLAKLIQTYHIGDPKLKKSERWNRYKFFVRRLLAQSERKERQAKLPKIQLAPLRGLQTAIRLALTDKGGFNTGRDASQRRIDKGVWTPLYPSQGRIDRGAWSPPYQNETCAYSYDLEELEDRLTNRNSQFLGFFQLRDAFYKKNKPAHGSTQQTALFERCILLGDGIQLLSSMFGIKKDEALKIPRHELRAKISKKVQASYRETLLKLQAGDEIPPETINLMKGNLFAKSPKTVEYECFSTIFGAFFFLVDKKEHLPSGDIKEILGWEIAQVRHLVVSFGAEDYFLPIRIQSYDIWHLPRELLIVRGVQEEGRWILTEPIKSIAISEGFGAYILDAVTTASIFGFKQTLQQAQEDALTFCDCACD